MLCQRYIPLTTLDAPRTHTCVQVCVCIEVHCVHVVHPRHRSGYLSFLILCTNILFYTLKYIKLLICLFWLLYNNLWWLHHTLATLETFQGIRCWVIIMKILIYLIPKINWINWIAIYITPFVLYWSLIIASSVHHN